MSVDEVLAQFRASGALLEGHFKLSSGRHSGHYLQCARVLMRPARAARLAKAVVANIPGEVLERVDTVVSPAMGGLIIGHEVARVLDKDAMFLERPEGVFHLRRGFALEKGARVLMVEDVVTTGLSSREAIAAVAREGGEVIAECALIDRSKGTVDLGVPFHPLAAFDFPTYAPDDIPPDLAAVAVTKPGSRK
jgi:orotate phosphoribosyltransferase